MGENCLSIMQKRVFDKLGFGKINWLTSPEGHNTGGWGMYLTADQISTLAQLLLQKGNWKGEQPGATVVDRRDGTVKSRNSRR